MWLSFICLLDILVIGWLSIITKCFILKIISLPLHRVVFYSFTWDMILLGKQSLSHLHWKSIFMELSADFLSSGGMELLQSFSAFTFRRIKGKKVNCWASCDCTYIWSNAYIGWAEALQYPFAVALAAASYATWDFFPSRPILFSFPVPSHFRFPSYFPFPSQLLISAHEISCSSQYHWM